MTELALAILTIFCAVDIIGNILSINGELTRRYSYRQYGINIVINIAWIIISIVALYSGGGFAAAAISVATVFIIICIIGEICAIAKYETISDAIGLAMHIALLIMFLSIGG